MNALLEPAVDPRNPWLGLASFTEETRAYFFGRDEEVAELARRVQRKLLTILFGQSGLGKTSILRAGLVPRLRSQGYCPVYVRIDYAADAPEPAEQIKRAIALTASGSGQWTQAGVAASGESLWEFLHHRDDVLKDEAGRTLIPLLIFDQFEEIFTLAQNDDTGRARAARFIQDLADLVENRPPRELEARLDADDEAAARFDFGRSDYRVLIALREDYLAPLESLKRAMPSIAQNRLRLAPMTGKQALAAVMQPGKGLVNEEVASAIVRFVAGGAELANAEVEPALLSLVCRELNDARLAQGRNEISSDLLDGSQNTILSNFYERSLADQPPAVRHIIEEELLTASGFRENIAEERLLGSLRAANVPATTLATLVNRRLLRIEERLDVRRVELTHDVLCAVVKASRDLRQEREAREASERLLEEQRRKEAAARHSLVRARQIAAVCGVLALAAIAAAVLAIVSTRRAHRAEAATQQARVQAESLLGFLSDDFSLELTTYGQGETVLEIAQRQIDYFHGLPPELKGIESVRNGALAMVNYASAARRTGKVREGESLAREAIQLLEQSRARGDASAATTIALSRAYDALSALMSVSADPAALGTGKQAVALIRPLAIAPGASLAARRAYAESLIGLGFDQSQLEKEWEDGVRNLTEARETVTSLGAREVKTPQLGAMYVSAAVWEAEILTRLGRASEAMPLDLEADRIGRKVLEQRPDYIAAMHDVAIINLDLADMAAAELDPAQAIVYGNRAWDLAQNLLRHDPNNSSSINNAAVNLLGLGQYAWAAGKPAESIAYYDKSNQIYQQIAQKGAWFVLNSLQPLGMLALRLSDSGADDQARTVLEQARRGATQAETSEGTGSKLPAFTQCTLHLAQGAQAWGMGDFKTVESEMAAALRRVQNVEPEAAFAGLMKYNCEFYGPVAQGEAQLWLGKSAAALDTLQSAITVRAKYPPGTLDDTRALSMAKVLKAMALARLGRLPESRSTIEPELKFQRDLLGHNKGDMTQLYDAAYTLYVASLTDESHRSALRHEALALLGRVTPEFAKLRSTTRIRKLIESNG